MSSKKKVLFIMQLPPPLHGSSMASDMIRRNARINADFACRYINLSASSKADDVTNYSPLRVMKKLWRFFAALLKTLHSLIFFRPEVCYVTITCHGIPFLKDAPFVLLSKIFGARVVLHQHNKGMASYVNKPLYRWLLPLVYKNTVVVLLSWSLYDDISSVVSRKQVKICPNGI